MFKGLFKRLKGGEASAKPRKKTTKDDAEYIVLFGTQYGSTEGMAKAFFKGLVAISSTT